MPDISTIKPGDEATTRVSLTTAMIDAFAALSHDDNPLHMSDAFARERGFPSRVAHGMLALSLISKLIGTQLPGPGALWVSQELQFAAPVFAGDELEGKVTVQSVSLAAQIVVLQTQVTQVASGAVVLRGTAKVRVPRVAGEAAS